MAGGLLSWLGKKIKLTDGSFWTVYFNNETWSGSSVTPETAMNVSAFWSCTRLLSQLGATLPFRLYDNSNPDSPKVARDHPLYGILHNDPNEDQTPAELIEGLIVGLCINGNGYAEKIMEGGQLVGLRSISGVKARREKTSGRKLYRFIDPITDKQREETEDVIFHVKGFGDGNLLEGLSPLAYARQSLGLALANDEAAARTFKQGGRPGGFFVTPKKLTPEQREQADKVLVKPYEGQEGARKIGILEAGFDWKQVSMSPEDTQMLESRRFNVEEVCRWLGVPPIMIGHAAQGQTMWGTGVEQILIQFYTTGLRPLLVRLEQSIRKQLLSAADRKVFAPHFAVEGMLRADSAARAAFYQTMTMNGLMTRNECREKENLPKSTDPGADSLTVQAALVLLESLEASPQTQDPSQEAARAARRPVGVPTQPEKEGTGR